ncbi:AraC family transcriptional regulator [Marinomonas agarivorans]|nr:AraC family transcriptional regulator [Marinomonas agarivorans]
MKQHFHTLTEYCHALGKPAPEHPQFMITEVETNSTQCLDDDITITTDFYIISCKKILSGELIYGRTKFDFQNGTMAFFAPNQSFSSHGGAIHSRGRVILFHRDFIHGHKEIEDLIKKSSFFGYSVHEALHLSHKEEEQVNTLFDAITTEYNANYDNHSKAIILSHVTTLLKYANRFYQRQFIQRQEVHGSTYDTFAQIAETKLTTIESDSLLTISDIAKEMRVSKRYLSDALKAETGKSAKEWLQLFIIEQAKSRLTYSDKSVASIAYSLGFEYPQYFTRLFKNKVGVTPTEYRKKH